MPSKQLLLVLTTLSLAACQTNQSGHLAALKTGTVTQLAGRGSPVDQLRVACGDGAPTAAGATTLEHPPYLQQVTTSSAMFGWVGKSADAEIEITTLDKQSLMAAAGTPEPKSLRQGDIQMWARAEALEPDTTYCYSLWSGGEQLTAPTGFHTAPTADSGHPVRFLAFGDSGGGGGDQYALLEQMYTVPFDLMLNTGDLAYGNGTLGQIDSFVFGVYADLFRNRPLYPTPGNHDYETQSGAPYREVFALPGDSGERWYSFDWGNAHFVSLDVYANHAEQAKWLDADLAASTVPWKIVELHTPLYSSGEHGSDTNLRNLLEPILQRHGVQLVLTGHDHNYERVTPQKGVTHIVTGGGGVGTRPVGTSGFTAFSEDVIHFVYGEITGDQMVLHAIDATGREFDSVIIPRTPA